MSNQAAQWRDAQERVAAFKREIARVIVGQESVVEQMLVALLCRGHVLIVGVPGLAKTLLVSTLGHVLGLSFRRIQFTPDLMPTDILGSEILQDDGGGRRHFEFVRGPVFAHLILADEINRTPPKTQAALLEAMQEHQITQGGRRHPLTEPFFVLATQNPIEQEGTYPLPEAQLDRFMFELWIDYPAEEEEQQIVRTTTAARRLDVEPVLGGEQILRLQQLVRRVPVADEVVAYAVRLVRASRPGGAGSPEYIRRLVNWGAGPRASQYLILAGKARAILDGRHCVSLADVRAAALPVLRHRLVVNYHAEADNVTAPSLVERLLADISQDSKPA